MRTSGRYAGAQGGDGKPSWLLIKHKDDWAGPVDIAEFAPLSVKSKGDFADILSQDDPGIWTSNRPAATGESGKMFARIVEQALAMRTPSNEAPPEKPGEKAARSARKRTRK